MLASALNLAQQDILNKSKEMLYRIEEAKALKGHSIETKVALVVFMTARNLHRSKTFAEIIEYIRTTKREISLCYKLL